MTSAFHQIKCPVQNCLSSRKPVIYTGSTTILSLKKMYVQAFTFLIRMTRISQITHIYRRTLSNVNPFIFVSNFLVCFGLELFFCIFHITVSLMQTKSYIYRSRCFRPNWKKGFIIIIHSNNFLSFFIIPNASQHFFLLYTKCLYPFQVNQ